MEDLADLVSADRDIASLQPACDGCHTGLRCVQQSHQHANDGHGVQPGRLVDVVNRRSLLRFRLATDLLLSLLSPETGCQIDDLSALKEAAQFSFA